MTPPPTEEQHQRGAERLVEMVGPDDDVARFAGGVFAVIVEITERSLVSDAPGFHLHRPARAADLDELLAAHSSAVTHS